MRLHAPCGIALAFLCSSCAHMSVQVDVLNPAYVEAHSDQDAYRKELIEVVAETRNDIVDRLGPSRDQLFAQYDYVGGRYAAAALTAKAPDDAASLRGAAKSLENAKRDFTSVAFEPTVDSLVRIKDQIIALLQQRGGDVETNILDGVGRTPDDVTLLLRKRNALIRQYGMDVQEEYAELGGWIDQLKLPVADADAAKSSITQSSKAAQQYLTSLLGPTGDIASDANAYLVSSAPKDQWHPKFNKTVVNGSWGNINTAIKLDGQADFTIKGVTFDPSKVAQVASKVATQALLMSAQIAGVPVKLQSSGGTSGQSDTGQALATASTQLASTTYTAAATTSADQDYRAALVDIAQAILTETPAIEGPKSSPDGTAAVADRLAAIQAIQASFKAQSARLTIATPAAASTSQ